MKWKIPEAGDTRKRRKFALLPICMEGACYWLQWLTVEEVYVIGVTPSGGKNVGWRNHRLISLG